MPSSSRPDLRLQPHRPGWAGWAGALTGCAVGVAVLGPALWHTGFILGYDMVFVPRLPLSTSTLGIDGHVPRAVPNDVVVALLSTLLPGWFVQRMILLGAFIAVGVGVDRVGLRPAAAVAATIALTWNPWVGERLTIGHWGYLWGYAALVWVCAAALRRMRGEDGGRLVTTALVMGALSGSTGGVLVGLAALVLVAPVPSSRTAARRLMAGVGAWVALNAAWWFPFLTLAPASTADIAGVNAFAARADSAGGVVTSLLTGGGIWHTPSWFASRQSAVFVMLALALITAGHVGWLRATSRRWRWILLAVIGLVLAGAGSTPGVKGLLHAIVLDVPGGGLLRDGQKFAALTFVPAGFGLGLIVADVTRRARGTLLAAVVALAAVALPVVTLPDLAWGRHATWQAHVYPREYTTVARELKGSTSAVFPWVLYRTYRWNDNRTVLDPWQRLIDGRVLVNDDLPLRTGVVRGEDPDAARITTAVEAHDAGRLRATLHAAGVRYVILEKDQPEASEALHLLGGNARTIHDGAALRVLDFGPGAAVPATPWWAGAGLTSTGLAAVAVAAWNLRQRKNRPKRADRARLTR